MPQPTKTAAPQTGTPQTPAAAITDTKQQHKTGIEPEKTTKTVVALS